MATAFGLFKTALGSAGIAWDDNGIVGVQLPETDATSVRRHLRRRFGPARETAPPRDIQDIIAQITALLGGEPVDLDHIQLNLSQVDDFDRQVYAVARSVRFGETTSYGEIARRLGDVHLARDVGQSLSRNPFPIIVPCHRVLAANGKLGGFSARGGVSTKQRLLEIERASVSWQLPLIS